MTWSPYEEAQFDRRCRYCSKRIKRMYNGWQGYDALFICFTGELPMRSDLDRRHAPPDEESASPAVD